MGPTQLSLLPATELVEWRQRNDVWYLASLHGFKLEVVRGPYDHVAGRHWWLWNASDRNGRSGGRSATVEEAQAAAVAGALEHQSWRGR